MTELPAHAVSLAEAQRQFAAAVLTGAPESAIHLVHARASSSGHDEIGETLSPARRLSVYTGGYLTRLREVLESDHRFLPAVLGEPWTEIAHAYIRAHPSRHPNLNRFGKALPQFLRERGLAFAADLAALGVAMADAFDAAEFEPMDPAQLSTVAPEQWGELILRPNPSARVVASAWPIERFYQDCVDGDPAPAEPEPEPSWTLVLRRDHRVWRQMLTEAEATVFAALDARRPLAEALTRGAAVDPDLDVGGLFGRWCAGGLFV